MLDQLTAVEGVQRISHNVGFLYPGVPGITAGNAVSYVELGVKPEMVDAIVETAIETVRAHTKSENTGMAVKTGLRRCPELVRFTRRARTEIVALEDAIVAANQSKVSTFEITGSRGIIGAVAALGMVDCPEGTLMDVRKDIG